MKFTTNKYGDVSVRWQYENADNPVWTKAFLEQGEGKDKVTIREVTIKRRYAEKHDKELARKFSLEKLVKSSFDRRNDLQDRLTVWDAYKKRIPVKEEAIV